MNDIVDRLDGSITSIQSNGRQVKQGKRIVGYNRPTLSSDAGGRYIVNVYEVTLDDDVHIGYLYSRPTPDAEGSPRWVSRGLGDYHRPDPPEHGTEEEALQDLEQYLGTRGALA